MLHPSSPWGRPIATLCVLLLVGVCSCTISITGSNSVISSTNNFNVTITRTLSFSASTLRLTFPSGFNLATISTVRVNSSVTLFNPPSNNVVNLTIPASSQTGTLMVELIGLTNPSYVVVLSGTAVTGVIADAAAASTEDHDMTGSAAWRITPGNLTNCEMQFQTRTNARPGSLTIGLKVAHKIPSGTNQVMLGLPALWNDISVSGKTRYGALQSDSSTVVSLSSLSAALSTPTASGVSLVAVTSTSLTINFTSPEVGVDSWVNLTVSGVNTPPL